MVPLFRGFALAIGMGGFLLAGFVTAESLDVKTPVARGHGGAVASISHEASKAAMGILREGGNAIDAAVAAAAVLGVTDPFSCGIGGGGFMMVYLADEKRVVTIDHREVAPLGAKPTMFVNDGQPLPHDDAVASGLSVGVPGTVRGWHEALERFGTFKLKKVLQPAIAVAEHGFKVDSNFYRINKINENKFARFTSASKLYLKDGKALAVGTQFKNPDMARAYKEIVRLGVKGFYENDIAQAIVASVKTPPTAEGVTVTSGTMTLADLANYEARVRLPLHSKYRGHDIYGMGLPSSGGIAIAEALNILEGFDLKSMPRAQVEHGYLEASRIAYADRNAFVGDPEFVQVPVLGMLNKEYAAKRRQIINLYAANTEVSAGNPYEFHNLPSSVTRPRPAAAFGMESEHTTHLTVVDKNGTIVAYTFTIEDWGGSGIVVPGFGFLLNNELTDFNFTGTRANLPEPLKRPRSSISPTLVFKDDKPVLSLGSPGGATIITTVLQTLVNFFDLGMSIEQALFAPRMSQQNRPLTIIEPSLEMAPSKTYLESLGHQWTEPREIGAASAIHFADDGTITAVSEQSRHGGGSALVQFKNGEVDGKRAKEKLSK